MAGGEEAAKQLAKTGLETFGGEGAGSLVDVLIHAKDWIGPVTGEIAMAAIGFAASLWVTGSWRSIPGLRRVAREVQIPDPSFCLPPDYFPRPKEEAYFETLLTTQPQGILLVTGPPSSGKTALISRVLQQHVMDKSSDDVSRAKVGAPERSKRQGAHPRQVAGDPLYVNMRFGDFLSSKKLGCELSKQFKVYLESLTTTQNDQVRKALGKDDTAQFGAGLLRAIRLLPKAKEAIPAEVSKWLENLDKMGTDCSLESTIDQIQAILKRLLCGWTYNEAPKGERILPPIIVIDAAEELMRWEEKGTLNTLLRFLVGTTRERSQAHVLLVTSDSRFLRWLQNHIGGDAFLTQTIGDLSEEEAAKYYQTALLPRVPDSALRADLQKRWREVHELCGGRMHVMRKLVNQAIAMKSTSAAVQAELAAAGRRVLQGLAPDTFTKREDDKPPGWSSNDYLEVLRVLGNSSDGYVPYADVAQRIGAGKLEAMVEHGLLGLRAWSRAPGDAEVTPVANSVGVRYRSDLVAIRRFLEGKQGKEGELALVSANGKGSRDA